MEVEDGDVVREDEVAVRLPTCVDHHRLRPLFKDSFRASHVPIFNRINNSPILPTLERLVNSLPHLLSPLQKRRPRRIPLPRLKVPNTHLQPQAQLIIAHERILHQAHILKPPRKPLLQHKEGAEIPPGQIPLAVFLADVVFVLADAEVETGQHERLQLADGVGPGFFLLLEDHAEHGGAGAYFGQADLGDAVDGVLGGAVEVGAEAVVDGVGAPAGPCL